MKTIIANPALSDMAAFIQSHDVAIALAMIFAFAGAFLFSPTVMK